MANVVFVTLKTNGGQNDLALYLSNEESEEDETWYAYGTLQDNKTKLIKSSYCSIVLLLSPIVLLLVSEMGQNFKEKCV